MLVLFLGAGTFCQSLAQAPFHYDRQNQNQLAAKPSTDAKPPVDLDHLFSAGPIRPFTPLEIFTLPAKATTPWSEDAKVDPKMIVHPPQASLGLQPGIPVEQNQYSNLRMLPIDSPGSGLQAIPAQWLNLKVEAISTWWPRLEMNRVESGISLIVQAPAR
jgi:hypothetical protein